MSFQLNPLPYAFDALEPFIDTVTMQVHHDKHHAAYVNNLNGALEKYPELAGKSLEELLSKLNVIPDEIRTTIRIMGVGRGITTYSGRSCLRGQGEHPRVNWRRPLKWHSEVLAHFKLNLKRQPMGVSVLVGPGW
jgi:hypothetical protein